jgi:hypothetical protein
VGQCDFALFCPPLIVIILLKIVDSLDYSIRL